MKWRILLIALLLAGAQSLAQTTYSNLDDTLTNWQSPPCSNLNPPGSFCAGGNGTPTSAPTQTINNSTPSLDGESMLLTMIGQSGLPSGETTNVLWPHKVGANNAATSWVGTYHIYLPEVTNIQSLEYDQFQFNSGHRFMMGSQCENPSLGNGKWDIWNQAANSGGGGWVATTIACTLYTAPAVWHSIVWRTHRDPLTSTACSGQPCMYFDTLTVDGATTQVNLTEPSFTSSDPDNIGIQAQIDVGAAGGTAQEYIDELSLQSGGLYYVSATGSDSNTGLSETLAWAHAPGMATTCATGNAAAHQWVNGDSYIFRGGDTWGASCWPFTLGNGASTTSAYTAYVGVDLTWHSGGSFTRPIFSGGGSFPGTATGLNCSMIQGSFWPNGVIDNIEFTGLYSASLSNTGTYGCAYMMFNTAGQVWELKNFYAHGWSHAAGPYYSTLGSQCGPPNSGSYPSDTCAPGVNYASDGIFVASFYPNGNNASSMHDFVVDGFDTYEAMNPTAACAYLTITPGVCSSGFVARNGPGAIYNAVMKNVFEPINVDITGEMNYHDIQINNSQCDWDGVSHGDVMQNAGTSTVGGYFYNLFVNNYGGCASPLTPSTTSNTFVNFFNNVYVDGNAANAQQYEMGGVSATDTHNNLKGNAWNNTIEGGPDGGNPSNTIFLIQNGGSSGSTTPNDYVFQNNQLITSGSLYDVVGSCTSPACVITQNSNLKYPQSTWTTDGYLYSGSYPFYPPSAGVTVGTGTSNSSLCSALADSNAQAACLKDTTLGCAEISGEGGYVVSCPYRSPTIRSTTAPNVGAYEFSSSTSYLLTVSITGTGTVTSADGHINCPTTCTYSYPSGTGVVLTETPGAGQQFNGWSNGCTGTSSTCSVTVSSALTVGAAFITAMPIVSLSVTSLTFGSQASGTTSAGQSITMTNTGGATLTISSIAVTNVLPTSTQFADITTCGSSLAASAHCSITVTFHPTYFTPKTATLVITTNASSSPNNVPLTGTGVPASGKQLLYQSGTRPSQQINCFSCPINSSSTNYSHLIGSGTGILNLNTPGQYFTGVTHTFPLGCTASNCTGANGTYLDHGTSCPVPTFSGSSAQDIDNIVDKIAALGYWNNFILSPASYNAGGSNPGNTQSPGYPWTQAWADTLLTNCVSSDSSLTRSNNAYILPGDYILFGGQYWQMQKQSCNNATGSDTNDDRCKTAASVPACLVTPSSPCVDGTGTCSTGNAACWTLTPNSGLHAPPLDGFCDASTYPVTGCDPMTISGNGSIAGGVATVPVSLPATYSNPQAGSVTITSGSSNFACAAATISTVSTSAPYTVSYTCSPALITTSSTAIAGTMTFPHNVNINSPNITQAVLQSTLPVPWEQPWRKLLEYEIGQTIAHYGTSAGYIRSGPTKGGEADQSGSTGWAWYSTHQYTSFEKEFYATMSANGGGTSMSCVGNLNTNPTVEAGYIYGANCGGDNNALGTNQVATLLCYANSTPPSWCTGTVTYSGGCPASGKLLHGGDWCSIFKTYNTPLPSGNYPPETLQTTMGSTPGSSPGDCSVNIYANGTFTVPPGVQPITGALSQDTACTNTTLSGTGPFPAPNGYPGILPTSQQYLDTNLETYFCDLLLMLDTHYPPSSGCTTYSQTTYQPLYKSAAVTFLTGATVAPTFTSANVANFTLNAFNTFNVAASGNPPPTFTITSGTLPSTITLVNNGNNTATLSGTPTAAATVSLTIQASNSAGTANQSFTLNIIGGSCFGCSGVGTGQFSIKSQ